MIKKIYLMTLLLVVVFGSFEVINASPIPSQAASGQITAQTLKPINKPNSLPISPSQKANIMPTTPPSQVLPKSNPPTSAPVTKNSSAEAEKYVLEKKEREEKKAKDLELEQKKKEEDMAYDAQQSNFINKLSSLDYKTQIPPKKLYDRPNKIGRAHV
jgi:hypothetical protein